MCVTPPAAIARTVLLSSPSARTSGVTPAWSPNLPNSSAAWVRTLKLGSVSSARPSSSTLLAAQLAVARARTRDDKTAAARLIRSAAAPLLTTGWGTR